MHWQNMVLKCFLTYNAFYPPLILFMLRGLLLYVILPPLMCLLTFLAD